MILGWLRLLALVLIVLTVIYVLVSIWARSVRRENLENRFDAGGIEGDRETWIAQGLKEYDRGLRRKLLWLIYVVPLAVMALTAYLVND